MSEQAKESRPLTWQISPSSSNVGEMSRRHSFSRVVMVPMVAQAPHWRRG